MTPPDEYSGATARCRCPPTCPVCVPDACPRFLRPPRGFRDSSARVQIPKRGRALIPRSGVSPHFAPVVAGSATLKRIRTRHSSSLIHYRRLARFRSGTRALRRAAPRRISMMERPLVSAARNIFGVIDGERSATCNSRLGRFRSVNRTR